MQNIHELIGLIKGVNFDGVVNAAEIKELQSWITKNRNLACDVNQRKLISLLENVLEDGRIDNEERTLIIHCADKYASEHKVDNALLYELNGIINGIICDEIINDDEVRKLNQWLKDNDSEYSSDEFKNLKKSVSCIIADNIVTKDEQKILLDELQIILDKSNFESKLNVLRNLAREKKSIGIELIDILDDEKAIEYIHNSAQSILKKMLDSYYGIVTDRKEDVFISLVLIALLDYDSNFYDNVAAIYTDLYGYYSEQRIEGTIRSVINRYKTGVVNNGRTRIINTVLKNAIVPKYYLPAFFDFIYDIYRLNFEYELPEDIEGEFEFVYDGLKDSMDTESDELKLGVTKKSYKLIKSTKRLITDQEYEGLIKLSVIIVRLIDKHYWELPLHIVNPYLKYGYDIWNKRLQETEKEVNARRSSSDFRSRWEPKFLLIENDVCLQTPIHKIKSDYDYHDIYIEIVNNGSVVLKNDEPDIRQIIGGFQVQTDVYKVKNPLGKLSYRVMCGESVIYDSEEKLFRDILLFKSDGSEIPNNTDYEGNLFICSKAESNKLHCIFKDSFYNLFELLVHSGDVVVIGNEVINFSSFAKPGIFGEIVENVYIRKTDKRLPVYKQMSFIVVECEESIDKLELQINGKYYRLSDYEVQLYRRPGVKRYAIKLLLDVSGIYTVKINQIKFGKTEKKNVFEFAVDNTLEWNCNHLDDIYYVDIISELTGEVKKNFSATEYSCDIFKFSYKGNIYFYDIPIDIDAYSLDGGSFVSCDTSIWIEDINDQSYVMIPNKDLDNLKILNPDGKVLDYIALSISGIYKKAKIGSLLSYKESYDYVDLFFYNDNNISLRVRCYNKCIIDTNLTEIIFDPYKSELRCEVYYYGKGDIRIELKSDEGIKLNDSDINSGETIILKDIKSFNEYTVSIIEKKKGFLTKYVRRELSSSKHIFVAWEDLVGHTFKFKRVYYDQRIKDNFVRKHRYFNNSYITFISSEDSLKYKATIFVRLKNGKRIEYRNINPVDVEICSDNLDGEVDLAIEKDGDGLYLDFEHNSILDTVFDNRAVDIFSYILDISGVADE